MKSHPVVLLVTFILAAFAALPAQVKYDVVPLPARLGIARLGSESLSNKNTVVGTTPTSPTHAFVWRNGSIMRLPTLGGTCSYGNGISDVEHIVGTSCLP